MKIKEDVLEPETMVAAHDAFNLTEGKEYFVIEMWERERFGIVQIFFKVINDIGREQSFFIWRFKGFETE